MKKANAFTELGIEREMRIPAESFDFSAPVTPPLRHQGVTHALLSGLRILRAGAGLTAFLALAAGLLASFRRTGCRRPLERLGWKSLLFGFGIEIRCSGIPVPSNGVLFVANHVSWIDIPVLALLIDATFVAKHEVGSWPIIGALARRYGCLLIDRSRRNALSAQSEALKRCLNNSQGVILFPEGTTSDGTHALPFRSSLFAAAVSNRVQLIQPVTIRYLTCDGGIPDRAARRRVAWLGDDELLAQALAIAVSEGVICEVTFEELVTATDRKQAAAQCHQRIAARLAQYQDQAATQNLAA